MEREGEKKIVRFSLGLRIVLSVFCKFSVIYCNLLSQFDVSIFFFLSSFFKDKLKWKVRVVEGSFKRRGGRERKREMEGEWKGKAHIKDMQMQLSGVSSFNKPWWAAWLYL